jgi:Xaa-Pro dipeptidase
MAIDPERHARTAASLNDSPFDAVICSSPTEVLLLTGYWPVMGPSLALFAKNGEVQAIVPEDEAELAQKTSVATIIPYTPAGLHSLATPLERLKEPLLSLLRSLSLSQAHVGLQLTQGVQPSSYAVISEFRASLLELLMQLQPHAKYTGCDELLETMKAVKTSKELEVMQLAGEVAEAGFTESAKCIQPGVRETDVAASIQSAFERSHKAEVFQRSYGYFFCMSGPNSAKASAAYARTRQRVIGEGDLVMIHANTCADGYWTDLARTYVAGKPSDRQSTIRTAIQETRTAGLQAIRPGALARQVDHAVRSVMERHGYGKAFRHAAGHGVGFAAANPNGRPRIHPLSPDVLEESMTFNLEPAAYFEGYGGMRHCDLVAVTKDGARVMTKF